MARQFFVTPRVGTGTIRDPYRPKTTGDLAGYVAACNEALCLVLATGDTAATAAAAGVLALLADDLDAPVASLPAALRTRVQNGLNARGVPVTVSGHATVRDVLTALGRWFDPTFDLAAFFVAGE